MRLADVCYTKLWRVGSSEHDNESNESSTPGKDVCHQVFLYFCPSPHLSSGPSAGLELNAPKYLFRNIICFEHTKALPSCFKVGPGGGIKALRLNLRSVHLVKMKPYYFLFVYNIVKCFQVWKGVGKNTFKSTHDK